MPLTKPGARILVALALWAASTTAHAVIGTASVSANLDSRDYTLTVNSPHGNPSPARGVNSYAWHATVRVEAFADDYSCIGWTGSGSVPGSGSSSTAGDIMLTTVTSSITWNWTPCVATFAAQGGTVPDPASKSVTYGAAYGALATTERTGYTFAGWYTASSGGTEVTAAKTVTAVADHWLYAHWTVNTYTLTYDTQGGSAAASKNVTYAAVYGTLATTTRAGYTFAGWYTAATGGTLVTAATVVTATAPHTLYARWTANSYVVTFAAAGGTAAVPASITVTNETAYGTLANTVRAGYTFAGWWTGTGGTGVEVTPVTTVALTAAQTLYAKWTLNPVSRVTFDVQGGTATIPTSTTVTNGMTYGALPSTTRAGYTFGGWWTYANGAGVQVSSGTTVVISEDQTLYAKWTLNPVLTVTFDVQGGTSAIPAFTTVTNGLPYGALATTARAGFTFAGWWTGAGGTGTQVTSGTTVTSTAEQTLYAKWTVNAVSTVTFNVQGGTAAVPPSIIVTNGLVYATLATTTRAGYTFGGWWTAAGGTGAQVTSGMTVTITAAQTLYAKWTVNAVSTVTFDEQGGTAAVPVSTSVTNGLAYGTLATTTRAGYTFGGWWTAAEGGGEQVTSATNVTITAAQTLYAKWTVNAVSTVTFDVQGGMAAAPASIMVTNGLAYGALATTARAGFAFAGWWTGAGGTGTQVTSGTTVTITAAQTLYAKWTVNAVSTVTFDAQGGTAAVPASIIVTNGLPYGALAATTRAGSTFAGWYTAGTGGTQVSSATVVTALTVHALYAHWTANMYCLTVKSDFGTPMPPVGEHTQLIWSTNITCSVPSPTNFSPVLRYFCTGWAGKGSVPTTGSGTSVACTITNDSEIQWNWILQYKLDTAVEGNGSVNVPSGWQAYGATVVLEATSQGYNHFYAWAGDTTNCTANGTQLTVPMTCARSLVARFAPNTYTSTYAAAEGTVSPAFKVVAYGVPYGPLATPLRAGYLFDGWTALTNGVMFGVTSNSVVSIPANHTLAATWTAMTCMAAFDAQGGTVTPASKLVTFDAAYGALPAPARTGYTFTGWTALTNGVALNVASNTMVSIATNHTLTAAWSANGYTVAFDAQGGTVAPTSKLVTFDAAYGVLPAPARTGYTFTGWTALTNGVAFGVASNSVVSIPADHTLAATWSVNTYTATFDAQGGTVTPTNKLVTFDAAYGILPAPARAGYTFTCWTALTNGVTFGVASNTVVSIPTNHTLAATWSVNTYTATFDAQGGTVAPTNKPVTFDAAYGALPAPARTGYTFTGWNALTNGVAFGVVSNSVVSIPADHTLASTWTTNTYTVAFDAQGGFVSPANKTVMFDSAYGVLPTTTRLGYDFGGWWTGVGGTGAEVTAATPVTTASDHALHALWILRTYTVTFDLGTHGSRAGGGAQVQTVAHGDPAIAPEVLAAPGWTFEGWSVTFSSVTDPLTIVANYSVIVRRLLVASTIGSVQPALGTNQLAWGPVTCRVLNSPVTQGTQRYVCTGWMGSGSVPTNPSAWLAEGGTVTNVTFTLTNDSSIVWQWATEYALDTGVAGSGTVDVADGWYAGTSVVTVTATTAANHHFVAWSGDTNGCTASGAQIAVPMTQARSIMAVFSINTYTVTFDLGENGTCTGGGALSQTVAHGAAATAPLVAGRAGWVFNHWDTAFDNITGEVTVSAQYVRITNMLSVASAHGATYPAVGPHTYDWGSKVGCWVSDSETLGTTQYVCTGWTGTGSVPHEGTATNVAVTVTNDSSIAWQWATEYRLDVAVTGAVASTSVTSAWFRAGALATVEVFPADGGSLAGWKVDGVPLYQLPWAAGITNAGNWLRLPMDSARRVEAVLSAIPLDEALDTAALAWSTGGDALWFGQSDTSADGTDAAASGELRNRGESWVATTVEGPGTLSFDWRASCQERADMLTLYVDGAAWGRLWGESGWQHQSFALSPGAHTLRWAFSRGKSGGSGAERGWLDRVVWTPDGGANDLNFCTPSGWLDGFFLGNSTNDTEALTLFTEGQPLYLSYAFENGAENDLSTSFANRFSLVKGGSTNTFTQAWHDGLPGGYYGYLLGYVWPALQGLPPGTYTVICELNIDRAVGESNYANNGRSIVFTVVEPVTVTHVTAAQRPGTKLVDITYDVGGGSAEPLAVTLVVSNGAAAVSATHVTGAVGQGVAAGLGKVIVWDAGADWSGNVAAGLAFSVRAGLQPGPDAGAGAASAGVDTRDYQLEVISARGNPSPSAGFHAYAWRTTVTAAVDAAVSSGGTSYTCAGWNGAGSVPATGAVHTTGAIVLTQPTSSINWNWLAAYAVTFDLGTNGTRVGGGALTQTVAHGGAAVAPMVHANAGWRFDRWDVAYGSVTAPLAVHAVYAVLGLAEALDNTLVWTTGGSNAWYGQTAMTYDGVDAARSGVVGDKQTNWLQTAVSGAGTLCFLWQVSSETNYDVLRFQKDADAPRVISGTNGGWQQVSMRIEGAGNHTLRWEYAKDKGKAYGDDCGWLDQVVWTPDVWLDTGTVGSGSVDVADGWYAGGSNVVITATPAAGYRFVGWTGDTNDCTLAGADGVRLTAPMTRDRSLIANFASDAHTVIFDLGTNGVRVGGGALTQTVAHGGAAATPEVRANPGWRFMGWDATFTNVTVEQTIRAVYAALGLAEALDSDLVWITGGAAPWLGQTAETIDNEDAACSGTVGDEQASWLQTTVSGAGTLRFWWRVSSEDTFDWLLFQADGGERAAVSGETLWQQVSLRIDGLGEHSLRWEYAKDKSDLGGEDCGWLDQVVWTPDAPPLAGFALWTKGKGLAGDVTALFGQDRNDDGVPNGFEYAFGTNLPPGALLLDIRFANGRPVVETPSQDAATLPYVDVHVLGSTNLTDWTLLVVPSADTLNKPANRAWHEPAGVLPDKAFFKLKAELK